MKISEFEVNKIFEGLKSGEITRDEAYKWACHICNLEDKGVLEYIPKEREVAIWKAVNFIQGYDLEDSPDEYLYSIEDLQIAIDIFNERG